MNESFNDYLRKRMDKAIESCVTAADKFTIDTKMVFAVPDIITAVNDNLEKWARGQVGDIDILVRKKGDVGWDKAIAQLAYKSLIDRKTKVIHITLYWTMVKVPETRVVYLDTQEALDALEICLRRAEETGD